MNKLRIDEDFFFRENSCSSKLCNLFQFLPQYYYNSNNRFLISDDKQCRLTLNKIPQILLTSRSSIITVKNKENYRSYKFLLCHCLVKNFSGQSIYPVATRRDKTKARSHSLVGNIDSLMPSLYDAGLVRYCGIYVHFSLASNASDFKINF